MADEEKTRRGDEGKGTTKRLETMEAEKLQLLLQLQVERQHNRKLEESRRINDVLSRVMTHNAYMACILSVAPEGSICRSHPWVTRFLWFTVFVTFTFVWTAHLMLEHNIRRRFVGVLKDVAVGFTAVGVGIALGSIMYFGVAG